MLGIIDKGCPFRKHMKKPQPGPGRADEKGQN